MSRLVALLFALLSSCASPAVLSADLMDLETGKVLGTVRFDGDAYAVLSTEHVAVRARLFSKSSGEPLYPAVTMSGGAGIVGSVRRKTAETRGPGSSGSVPSWALPLFGPGGLELVWFGILGPAGEISSP